jgi:hypothetical protein
MKQVLIVQINSPYPPLEKRSQNVAFACRCLDVVKHEIARDMGAASSGDIVTTGTDGICGPQGYWAFDSSSSEP